MLAKFCNAICYSFIKELKNLKLVFDKIRDQKLKLIWQYFVFNFTDIPSQSGLNIWNLLDDSFLFSLPMLVCHFYLFIVENDVYF